LPDLDKVPANDSSFILNKRNCLLAVGIVTAATGVAFFKLGSKNVINTISENLSLSK
jgi:hypothetical protein